MVDADGDLDIDYGSQDEVGVFSPDRGNLASALTSFTMGDALDEIIEGSPRKHYYSDGEDEGEIDENEAQPTKVHLRFTNHHLTTKDLKVWAMNNCTEHKPLRIEWVDDNSSNIIYNSAEAAYEALGQLSTETIENEMHEMPAKSYDVQPDTQFFVRIATQGDVKAPHAAAASKHYLEHPENDPAERGRGRGRYNNNDRGRNNGNYRGRGNFREGARVDPDLDRGQKKFTVDMYDDSAQLVSRSPYRAAVPEVANNSRNTRNNSDRDLLPSKVDGSRGGMRSTMRSRSASPVRHDSRRYSRASRSPSRERDSLRRYRSRSPARRPSRRDQSPPRRSSNAGNDLLPGRSMRRSSGGRDLLDSASSAGNKSFGRLDGSDQGFRFKGSASAARSGSGNGGFNIKGSAASSSSRTGSIGGDLFPNKVRSTSHTAGRAAAGGDLMAGIGGRGRSGLVGGSDNRGG